jgi:tripartite-type tricarboxylate transporter receptor subunit TctC
MNFAHVCIALVGALTAAAAAAQPFPNRPVQLVRAVRAGWRGRRLARASSPQR